MPYAIALEDGRILWANNAFDALMEGQRKEKYLHRLLPQIHPGVYPKGDVDHVELEVSCQDRDFQAELRRVSLKGFSSRGRAPADPGGRGVLYRGVAPGCDGAE